MESFDIVNVSSFLAYLIREKDYVLEGSIQMALRQIGESTYK